ncbi:MAG: aminotransferase class IV [Sphingomonadaceae bacterium]
MAAQAYVNGRYSPLAEAGVAVEDRGFQFADSVYEVVAVLNGRFFDWPQHLWRLRRNLAALQISGAPAEAALDHIARTLLRRARVTDGLLYVQVSRGVARREHGFPATARPTLVMTARRFDFRQRLAQQAQGVAAISRPDQRWLRCDLKTTNLLGAVLAKEEARREGAFEALFHLPDGTVTEGGSTNIWMVDAAGALVTHPLSSRILPGIMRETALRLARGNGLDVAERPFSLEEARAARELLLTSTTAPVLPIVQLDAQPIGSGRPGEVAGRLARLLWDEIERQTGWRA